MIDTIHVHGLVFDLDGRWNLVAVSELHGAFARHVGADLTIHLRGYHRVGDAAWLRSELAAQNWIGPPFDILERDVHGITVVGGTFRHPGEQQLVREWFASDGQRAANAAVVFSNNTSARVLADFEQLIDTLRFATNPAS